MSSRADLGRRRGGASRPGLALVVSLLIPALAACQQAGPVPTPEAPQEEPAPSSSPSSAATPRVPDLSGLDVPADLERAFTRLLDRRARALRQGDQAAYDAVLDQRDDGFVVSQRGYFDNLVQLPLAELSYELQPASLVRTQGSYWVVVDVAMRLDGFDDAAVHTFDRFRFSPSGPRGAYRLSSTTDRDWEAANAVPQQPWDLEPVVVRQRDGVLGVFDEGTADRSDELVRAVAREAPDVAAQVPYGWSGSTVVYALSDDGFLDGLDVPGGDPATLDGLTFSLPSSPSDPEIAATRVVVQPEVLDQPARVRDRLVRHELTHLAVGEHDDRAPVWLSEGIAEYLSVRRQAPQDRRVSAEALRAARTGVDGVPADDTFNDADSAVHYGIAWWTVEYLAATYGPAALWTILDALDEPGVDPVSTTRRLTRLNPDQLARRGAKLLASTYAPRGAQGAPGNGQAGGQANGQETGAGVGRDGDDPRRGAGPGGPRDRGGRAVP